MTIFALEFVFFIVAMFAILVSVSTTALFAITYRYEKKLRSIWRALGFLLLGIAFFLFMLERKFSEAEYVTILAVLFLTFGFFSIYRGVRAEPTLSQLFNIKGGKKGVKAFSVGKEFKEPRNRSLLIIVAVSLVVSVVGTYLLTLIEVGQYVTPVLLLVSLVFVLLTLTIQIRRYRAQKNDAQMRLQNLYPLLGYVSLVVYLIASILHRLPEFDIVFLRKMVLDFSFAWHIAVYASFIAFIFLGIWAWNFIKVRAFLRIYVIFLALIVLVASLGALIFNYFLFNIVEKNNLDLMERGAETQELIMNDRSNIAMLIAELIAKDAQLTPEVSGNNHSQLLELTKSYLDKTNVDVIRVYNTYGEILASPTDIRDRGRIFWDDSLLAFSILEKRPVKSFATIEGVLADEVVTRAIYPILASEDSKDIIGAVEVGYKFDNAFTDYSKNQTGLESTIYSGLKRTATTILTLDSVSRWVGSVESDNDVLDRVLNNGEDFQTTVDRLGIRYYSAYKPIRNINGDVIGMVSVGVPTNILIEDAKQQLLSIFLIVVLTSLLASSLGALLLFYRQRAVK